MKLVKINNQIFREYDIRGIYGTDLDIDVAYTIGRAFGSYIQEVNNNKTVLVGMDARESSPVLSNGLIKGLLESGADVINLGLVTTPMYYYAKKKNKITSGLMVTASHNPREYNGFKISFRLIGNACGKEITDFRDYVNKGKFIDGHGTIQTMNIKSDYLEAIKKGIDLGPRKIKVVYDCGNGTGSIIVKDILDMFNIEYDLLYCDSIPSFPNHHPDPSVPANMVDLGKRVKELGYDLGIGIDGDADRVGLVDCDGNVIGADLIMLIVLRYLEPHLKKREAIYDVKCSKTLIDEIEKLGLKGNMSRTGASWMNIYVNEGDYGFGGEFAGHLFFRDKWMGFDDGIYAGLRLCEILSHMDIKSNQLLDNTSKYFSTEELKVHADDDIKFDIVEKVKMYCETKNYKMATVDGVRVTFDDGWALVRCSNTGPNLTIRFEAETEERLKEIQKEFTDLINGYLS